MSDKPIVEILPDGSRIEHYKGCRTYTRKTWKSADHYIADPANDGMFTREQVAEAKKRIAEANP